MDGALQRSGRVALPSGLVTVEAVGQEIEFSRGRVTARAGSCAWLALLVWPVWAFLGSRPHPAPVVAVVAGLALFASCWVVIIWRVFGPQGGRRRPWALTGLLAAALGLAPLLGPPWACTSFVFVVTALASSFPTLVFLAGAAVTAAVEVVTRTAYATAAPATAA